MFALAFGIGTKAADGQWLEVFYPRPLLNPDAAAVQAITGVVGADSGNRCIEPDHAQLQTLSTALSSVDAGLAELCATLANSVKPIVLTLLASDGKPTSVPEVYLKLHLLSHRLVRPHSVNL